MEDPNKKKKVLCPVTKEGKTYWMKMGIAFVNKDNSLNVYLDCLPTNGKLHVRDWDDGPGESPFSPPRRRKIFRSRRGG